MAKHQCEQCPIRARHDKNPKSLIGRFWRWHINFCPGWRSYYNSLEKGRRTELKQKYSLKS